MYYDNNILSIENEFINTYDSKFNNEEIISICLDFIKITTKKFNYYPTSYDIFNCVQNTVILQTEHIYNYVIKNKKQYIHKQNLKQTKNICLVTQFFNKINYDWLNTQLEIFNHIYIINYSNENINIPNVTVIKSQNIKYYKFDMLLLCNDLNKIYNKIFLLYDYQNINIQINNQLINDSNIIKDYFNNLSFNKYNFKSEYLLKLNNKKYSYNENFYYFASLRNHLITSNDIIYSKKKILKNNPIIIINNLIYDKIAQQNIHHKIISQNTDLSKIDDLYEYICYYFTNNIIDLKIKLGDIENFIEENYDISVYKIQNLNLITKSHSLLKYNIYDYQYFDNSILVKFNNNFIDDLILLFYFTKNIKQKKLFIQWNHKIKLSNFLIDEYYFIEDCIDNIYNYEVYNFIYFNTNINSPVTINVITNKLNLNFDNYNFIKEIYLSIKWNTKIQSYIDTLNTFDISSMLFIDLNDTHFKLFQDFIKINDKLLLFFNREGYNSINITDSYNILILELFISNTSFSIISDSKKNHYKINQNYINFYSLLKYSKYIYIENCQIHSDYLKNLFSYDNLLITNNNQIKELNKIENSQYIKKVYVLNDKNTNLYKINYTKSVSIAKAINKLIQISDNKCILIILNSSFDFKLFHYYKIDENTIYSNIESQVLYFSKNIFTKLNGFNEDINDNEIIVDFIERCNLFNIINLNIENSNYEFKTIWGPENVINHKIKKISKNYYEVV